jgi:hypothetical protein
VIQAREDATHAIYRIQRPKDGSYIYETKTTTDAEAASGRTRNNDHDALDEKAPPRTHASTIAMTTNDEEDVSNTEDLARTTKSAIVKKRKKKNKSKGAASSSNERPAGCIHTTCSIHSDVPLEKEVILTTEPSSETMAPTAVQTPIIVIEEDPPSGSATSPRKKKKKKSKGSSINSSVLDNLSSMSIKSKAVGAAITPSPMVETAILDQQNRQPKGIQQQPRLQYTDTASSSVPIKAKKKPTKRIYELSGISGSTQNRHSSSLRLALKPSLVACAVSWKKNVKHSKSVTWGSIHAREFQRHPGGGSAVPDEGTWALGLGKPERDIFVGPVMGVSSNIDDDDGGNASGNHHQSRVIKVKAERLTERERKKVFLRAQSDMLAEKQDKVDGTQHDVISPDLDLSNFAALALEQAQEFSLIRTSRETACGCSCNDLVKKVSKMHMKKLVAWLLERHVDVSQLKNKAAMVQVAKTLAAAEKNCTTEGIMHIHIYSYLSISTWAGLDNMDVDCECVRNGVGCHQDVCRGCQHDCHNTRYTYEREVVEAHRQAWLAASSHAQQQRSCRALHLDNSPSSAAYKRTLDAPRAA